MSEQAAKQFIEKWQKDPNFKKKLSQAKNSDEVKKVIQENGFNFTKAEFKAVAKQMKGKECSEEELKEIVAGSGQVLPSYFE
jgi:predicted ribosomally synthesized peptide with nif11-like leader